jgi:DNA-binding NarL/FixJ family response regulator
MNEAIRVLLADDHPIVRVGITAILNSEPDMEVVGEKINGNEAQFLSTEKKPDVLLLDLNMPGPLSVDIVSYLRNHIPEIAIIVLGAHDDDIYVRNLISAGAIGYVLKDEAPDMIIQAIRTASGGGSWFSRGIVHKLAQLKRNHSLYNYEVGLASREQELLSLIANGWNNSHIADKLSLAEQTVRNYISRLYVKLNVQSRGEAIAWARERGLRGA